MNLQIAQLHKRFDSNEVVRGIDISVPAGEVIGLIGSSGAGKSTILRCVNFLERPDAGSYTLAGVSFDVRKATKENITYLRRNTAMVFQNFNLYKEKTAVENVMLALTHAQRKPPSEAKMIALDFLDQVGLYGKRNSFPHKLSGGQQQRVALARAAVLKPKIMLVDEPTSALDPENVGEVLDVIRKLADAGQSMIIASHEMSFLYHVADHVLFLENGQCLEEGPPDQLFHHPQQERTRQFLARVKV